MKPPKTFSSPLSPKTPSTNLTQIRQAASQPDCLAATNKFFSYTISTPTSFSHRPSQIAKQNRSPTLGSTCIRKSEQTAPRPHSTSSTMNAQTNSKKHSQNTKSNSRSYRPTAIAATPPNALYKPGKHTSSPASPLATQNSLSPNGTDSWIKQH
jgi:hypothetical protein